MSTGSQAVFFNAVPLLVVSAAYLAVTATLAPVLWRERRRMTTTDFSLTLIFPCIGVSALIYGALVIDERAPLGGHLWLSFAAALVALAPPLLFLSRWGERALLATGGLRAREAEEVTQARERELDAVAGFAGSLARLQDLKAVARLLIDECTSLMSLDLGALVLVDEQARRGQGILLRSMGRDADWFGDVVLDFEQEPSGVASAVFEGTAFAVYDTATSRRVNQRLVEQTGVKSAAYVPLVVRDHVIAVFVGATIHDHRAFSGTELTVMQSLANEAALALERIRTDAVLHDALEEQAALLRAAHVLAGELQLEGVLKRLVEQVARLVGGDAADCYLLDADRGMLRCAAVYGLPEQLLGFEFPVRKGVSGAALERGRAIVAVDYPAVAEPIEHPAYAGVTSAVVAPISWSDQMQGVLGVASFGERVFTEADAARVEVFAGLASLALRNAEAFDQVERQARVQEGFYRIASVLGQSLSLADTLDAVAQAAAEAFGGDFAAVLMPRGDTIELTGSHELPAELSEALDDGLPDSASCLGIAAADGRVLAAGAVSNDDRFGEEWRALAAQAGFASLLAVPVAAVRTGRGLAIVFFAESRTFTNDDLEVAGFLGDAARGALERSELFEAERTSRTLAQQLAQTGGLLATELDPEAVLDEVVQQATALLGADASAIRVLDGEELAVRAVDGVGTRLAIGTHSRTTAWLSGDVVQSLAPVAVEDASGDRRLVEADVVLANGYRSFLGVPLVGPEGTLHGTLAVYARRPRRWREEEIEALQALAGNTSGALSNAELFQRVTLEKERSFAILGNVADGIVAVDRDEKVVLWNAAAERITGVPAEEALGRTAAQVLQQELETTRGGEPVRIRRGSEDVYLSLSEAVMRDPAGAVAGRIFAFRDISADRLVEQMKSSFVSTVSHELRRPLTSIYGFAETLLREDVEFGEEERRIFLGYIARESERLTAIVDALLNVARLDSGDLQVNLEPTDVGSIVSDVIATAEHDTPVDGHRFVVDLPVEPVTAEADPEKLRQVCSILVENAIKYSPGGGTVTVGARRRDEIVEVRVVDEGIGIPEIEHERIFRKFYRADHASAARATGGPGLGLFIARGLVAAMGGRIWVNSEQGRGSSFVFELPLANA